MQDNNFDIIIVGSGLAGVHAAYPLVNAGLKVAIIDGGVTSSNPDLEKNFPFNFEQTRKKDSNQYELFLGEDLKNIVSNEESHVISMTSGNRKYITHKTEALPLKTDGVELIQTLAKGGLSEAWSSASDIFDAKELETVGIPSKDMPENYAEIISRIGLSGHIPGFNTMPGIRLDYHAKEILETYTKMNPEKENFIVKPSILGVVTEKFKGREAISYKDMEFFLNHGNSIYRARFTLSELEDKANFTYIPQSIVNSISSQGESRVVHVTNFDGERKSYTANYVILAAGAISTSRILLKTFNLIHQKLPFITKNHFIIPTLRLFTLGKKDEENKCSLTQLFIIDKREENGMAKSFSQVISYKSLLLYKLAKFIPLPAPEALSLISLLAPSMVSIDIKFPSIEDKNSFIYLDEKDTLHVHAKNKNQSSYKKEIREIKRLLLKLGLLPLQTVNNPFGSTAHYTGGIPFNGKGDFPLSAKQNGCLNQDNHIYVADASTWRAQPAKPPGLTIMANANRIGKEVLKNFKKN